MNIYTSSERNHKMRAGFSCCRKEETHPICEQQKFVGFRPPTSETNVVSLAHSNIQQASQSSAHKGIVQLKIKLVIVYSSSCPLNSLGNGK